MYPHKFSQYGELQPTSGWDRSGTLGHPCKSQPVSRLGSVTACHSSRDVREWLATFPFPPIPVSSFPFPIPFPLCLRFNSHPRPVTKLSSHSIPIPVWLMNDIYHWTRMWANAQRDGRPAEHRCRPLLLHGTLVVDVSQTLQRWTEAPPIFGRAAITLGIGSHSSLTFIYKMSNYVRNFVLLALYTHIWLLCQMDCT